MLTIYREGLTIIANEPLEPSEGSYNVPVQLIETGEDTYSGSITMYVGWYQKGIIKKRSIVAYEPGKFRIPAIALQQNGPLFVSFLLENEDKTEGLMTNTLTYIVKDAPYTTIDPTTDPTWQEQVKAWIEGLVDSTLTKEGAAAESKTVGDRFNEFSKRIDSLGGGVTSWNDLTGKPFYTEQGWLDLLPSQELAFEFDTEVYMHMLETPIVFEQGKTYKVTWDGVEYECLGKIISIEDNLIYYIGDDSLLNGEASNEPFNIAYNNINGTELCFIVTKEANATHTVQIQCIEVDLFPSQEITFADVENGIKASETTVNCTLTENDTYNVMWDSVVYQCDAKVFSMEGMSALYLGDLSIGTGEDSHKTGEPFLLMYMGSNICDLYSNDAGTTHTFRVYQGGEVVHQLDSKYVNAYTKEEINTMFGTYVDEVDALLGGSE